MSEHISEEQSSDKVLNAETWHQEAEATINDIRRHVITANISNKIQNTNQCIHINLTTLENKDFCIEMSPAGFRVIGRSYDSTSYRSIDDMNFETPYALLNSISRGYKESFGGELMNRLLDLAKKCDTDS